MRVFLDTSVLVAACEQSHPHFAPSAAVLRRVLAGRDTGLISLHSIAETYAVLTRLPVQPRIHPAEAAQLIGHNIVAHFQTVPLDRRLYLEALTLVSEAGWPGAKIYDALLVLGAERGKADRVYTWNLRDFQQLAPPALRAKLTTP